MPKAEGKRFPFDLPAKKGVTVWQAGKPSKSPHRRPAEEARIKTDFLETFPYPEWRSPSRLTSGSRRVAKGSRFIRDKGNRQVIQYTTKEFSAVCPFSGLPDIATIIIEYIPNKRCVELKSLKYYFVSFRNVGIYQEAVTNRIFQDLWRVLRPRYLSVKTIYNTRGGIDAVCTMEKGRR